MLTVNSTLHNEEKETQYIHFFKYFNFVHQYQSKEWFVPTEAS